MSIIHWADPQQDKIGKTDEERLEAALAYFATGKSCRECEKLTGTNYKAVQREAKKRGIEKGQLSQLVTKKAEVDAELVPLTPEARFVVTKEADLRQKHIAFFNNAAIKNVTDAMKAECENQNDFKARAETINKGRETVLGKTPDVAVQVNNSLSLEELLKDL